MIELDWLSVMLTYPNCIREFSDEYRFLSNFAPASIIGLDSHIYPTVEHAFQAAKTEDEAARAQIRNAPTPAAAKRLGRNVTLRKDWEQIKESVMYKLHCEKFLDQDLAAKLIATYPAILVESNKWGDTFWGVCGGIGRNKCGQSLMRVRNTLLYQTQPRPIPSDATVERASGEVRCYICGDIYYRHPLFRYPDFVGRFTDSSAVRSCDGHFLHL